MTECHLIKKAQLYICTDWSSRRKQKIQINLTLYATICIIKKYKDYYEAYTVLPTPWPWAASIQNMRKRLISAVLSHLICGTLLQQPQETNIQGCWVVLWHSGTGPQEARPLNTARLLCLHLSLCTLACSYTFHRGLEDGQGHSDSNSKLYPYNFH